MKSFTYTIVDPVGIHARPAGLLVKTAKAFSGYRDLRSPRVTRPSRAPS